MTERESILQELSVKLSTLIGRYNELRVKASEMEQRINVLEEQNKAIGEAMDSLKMAKAVRMSNQDIRQTRLKISSLIREIDKCIALLSV